MNFKQKADVTVPLRLGIVRQSRVTDPPDGAEIGLLSHYHIVIGQP